jgi:pectinesterase
MQIVHARDIQFVRSQIKCQSGPPVTQEDATITELDAPVTEVLRVLTVAPDAHGDAAPIQAAIDGVPAGNRASVLVTLAPGSYAGPVTVPGDKANVTLHGLGKDRTQVVLTAGAGETTLTAASPGLRVENLTLENTAGRTAGPNRALMCSGDRQVYENVLIKGWQDTLWAREPKIRLYFHDCDIWGSVDFIYGAATALFDDCDITERRDTGGPLTAPSTPQEQPFGLVFLDCRLINGTGGMDNTTLGRPWRPFGASAFLNCVMGDHVKARGWSEWDGREKTCRFCEYGSRTPSGALLDLSRRVPWAHRLTAAEAARYTPSAILGGWNPAADSRKI